MEGPAAKRAWLWVAGLVLLAVGLAMPHGWYDALPRDPALPPAPIKGVVLLQAALVAEGLALLLVGLLRRGFSRIDTGTLARPPASEEGDVAPRTAAWALAAITLLAVALRFYQIGADLWLDEIAPVQDYAAQSALEVLATYTRSNNHLLNTLLVKLCVHLFGEREWAIRLPAVLFGVATVPALYWVARPALTRRAALGAALLLAVSYHHIFFSQNARGYAPYVLFSLLACGFLVRGLAEDRRRWWVLYVAAMVLDFASLLHSGFVFAAHALVGAAALVALSRRGAPVAPLAARLSAVFVATGLLGFQLYAAVLPDVYVVGTLNYQVRGAGFAPLSTDFARELVRGVAAGFGTGAVLAAVPFLALTAYGLLVLIKRQWILVSTLVLPAVVLAAFMLLKGLAFSPRFFIFGLPVAVLGAVQGIESLAEALARRAGVRTLAARRLAAVLVTTVALISLASLGRYYRVPKQPYRAALRYLATERQPGDVLVLVQNAERGFRWYGRAFGLSEGDGVYYLRTDDSLRAVLDSHPGRRVLIVTTFRRPLMRQAPDLYSRIERGWQPERVFPSTINDGAIAVWAPKP